MTSCSAPGGRGKSNLTISVILFLIILSVLTVYFTVTIPKFGELLLPPLAEGETYHPGGIIYEVVYNILNFGTNVLYLVGGGVIAFGAIVLSIKFLQCKLRNPLEPSCVTRYLSGDLTLSLEFFIGAEIIKTVIVRTEEEFILLILVIISRGLFSLILYLERRWHGEAESE